MAQMSDYLEENLMNHVFRNTNYAPPGTVYLSLFSTDPTDADVGTEIAGNGYARKDVSFIAPVDGVSSNDPEIIFPAATADWDTITHIGLRDASTAGNLLMHQALTTPVAVLTGNNFRIPVNQLVLTFA
ncbi:MAG: hypothetical protein KAH01_07250 [Caldisericia bacterium]|nr:hypothetical protein [Caldisericia bacterium]